MRRIGAIILLFFCASRARAWTPLDYPLSSWGELSTDFNKFQGPGTQGWVQQGVDWFKLPGDVVFDTFGGYYWMTRAQHQTFYDQNGPYAGAMLSRGAWSLGGQYYWETFPGLQQYLGDFQAFATWYKVVDLGKPSWLSKKALGAPFSTWGRLQYDPNKIEGYGSMGWFQQGIDWFKLPGNIMFDTFGIFRWMERSRNMKYYNEVDPAVGIELSRGALSLYIEYDWERFPNIPETIYGPQVFLTWYVGGNMGQMFSR